MAKFSMKVSEDRAAIIHTEIASGSEPETRFYLMVAASSAIAAFGLIKDSTAIVIGAMLVAPLMTPIFGIALALVRGDAMLLKRSLQAEFAGIILAIGVAVGIGILMPEMEITQEMLSRTKPNILDLVVAVLSGFAGAYALVDEKISPALPGVAIATAIVPPLANSGLCIAVGAYYGAVGSFLLFFANFLSILLVAATVFFASGMALEMQSLTKKDLFRRFSLSVIGFLVISVFLSHELVTMVQDRKLKGAIQAVLTEGLSHLPTTGLQNFIHQKLKNTVYVLAHIHAPVDIAPSRVKILELALEKRLDSSVELFVRSTLSRDISAAGTINKVDVENLNGFYFGAHQDPLMDTMRVSEQIIREYLSERLGFYVEEINLLFIKEDPYILATVYGIRNLSNEEIRELEMKIRQATAYDRLYLVVRHVNVHLYDKWGHAYAEMSMLEGVTPAQQAKLNKLSGFIEKTFSNSSFFLINTNMSIREGAYQVLVELSGPKIYPQEAVVTLKKNLTEIAGAPVKVYVHYIPEVVVTEDGYMSFDGLKKELHTQTERIYEKHIKKILEGSY